MQKMLKHLANWLILVAIILAGTYCLIHVSDWVFDQADRKEPKPTTAELRRQTAIVNRWHEREGK